MLRSLTSTSPRPEQSIFKAKIKEIGASFLDLHKYVKYVTEFG